MRYFILVIVFIFACLTPFLSGEGVDIDNQFILIQLRYPRFILAFLVGGSLALIGWVFQIIFKNPLATPYTMGISSIAALAMTISELLLENSIIGSKNIVFLCFYTPMILFILYSFKMKVSKERLLLFGVCIGIFSSSAIVFSQSLLGNESVNKLVRWMMGGLDIVGYTDFYTLIPLILFPVLAILLLKKQLTMISIGEEFSIARGINVQRVNLTLILMANISVGAIVWFCGPIGFVGLIIPHLIKSLFSNDISKSATITFISGAIFLVLCDFISRIVHASHVIPVGAITACIGAPLLVYNLIRKP